MIGGSLSLTLLCGFVYAMWFGGKARRLLQDKEELYKSYFFGIVVFDAESEPLPRAISTIDGVSHSWRVDVELRQDSGFPYDVTQPWNSPSNVHAAKRSTYVPYRTTPGGRVTQFFAVAGVGTAYPLEGNPVRLRDISDGLENTILLLEYPGNEVVWTSPACLNVSELETWVSDCLLNASRPLALFADKQVLRFAEIPTQDVMDALVSISGGEAITRDQLIENGVLIEPFP
jgi:hypothetical protein